MTERDQQGSGGVVWPRTRRSLMAKGVTAAMLRGPGWQRTGPGWYVPAGVDATATRQRIA